MLKPCLLPTRLKSPAAEARRIYLPANLPAPCWKASRPFVEPGRDRIPGAGGRTAGCIQGSDWRGSIRPTMTVHQGLFRAAAPYGPAAGLRRRRRWSWPPDGTKGIASMSVRTRCLSPPASPARVSWPNTHRGCTRRPFRVFQKILGGKPVVRTKTRRPSSSTRFTALGHVRPALREQGRDSPSMLSAGASQLCKLHHECGPGTRAFGRFALVRCATSTASCCGGADPCAQHHRARFRGAACRHPEVRISRESFSTP